MALDGDYTPDDEDEIFSRLLDTATEIDSTLAVGEGTINRSHLRTVAQLIASDQEQALDALYDASYIETASGDELDRRVRDIGITRNETVPATGVVELGRTTEPSGNFTIPSGTLVQPAGSNVPTFETTETTSIGILDDYEGSVLPAGYTGDTGSVSVVDGSAAGDPSPDDGSYMLRLDATGGVSVHNTDTDVADGDTIRFSVYVESNTTTDCLYHVQDSNNQYRITVDASGNAFTATKVDGGTSTQLKSESVTIPTGAWLTVDVDTGVNTDTNVTLIDSSGNGVSTLTFSDSTYESGHIGMRSSGSNDQKYLDTIVTTVTAANVEGTAGGTQTNVGPESITEFVNQPTGITFVSNRVPTGDTSYVDTDGNTLVTGQDREGDEELRDRALKATSIGGAGTVSAVGDELRSIDNVVSVKVFENDTLTDNTGSGGLPEISIEPVVFGGDSDEIAQNLFDTVAATERLYSGAHGSTVSKTIYSQTLEKDVTIEFSRPPKQTVDITLDITVDDTYIGDTEIKDIIAEYIGGTKSDGSVATGLGIGQDIRIDAVRDRIVGPDTGVLGISSVSSTPSTSTSGTGLTIIDIGTDEVAQTDVTDGSITLNVSTI